MAKRNDIHSPSKLVAGDYEFIGCIYQGSSDEIAMSYDFDEYYKEGMDIAFETGPLFQGNFVNHNTCDHCGHVFSHGAVYLHAATNEHVVVGWICAGDYFDNKAAARLRVINRGVAQRRKNIAKLLRKKKAMREYVANNAEIITALKSKDHKILKSLRGNLNEWGSLSVNQGNLVKKIAAEAPEITAPCLEGKIEVTGKILGFKEVPDNYSYYGGSIVKMVFKDDRGFTLYGTRPSRFKGSNEEKDYLEKGDRIKFSATVQKSTKDETFGFFKRPTKCEVIGL